MYRVLLADDESLDLEGVQRFIPWSDLNMEVVAAVNSGFAALEVMEHEGIDILVTDVRMPNMSGLELARKALDKWSSLKIIFISGYQDFHYVKQAIALKAYSYVLKPMDDNELIESLLQIKNDLDRDQKQKAEQAYKNVVMPIDQNAYVLYEKKHKKNWKLIQEIEKYMQLNLHSNITLRDLANRFSFTPNYLGFMFKEGTGKSFSECLVDMRMERAWELLQNPTIKIYEVADQVGYRHLPYFSKQFKETFGMTPNECRRQT